MPNSVTTASVAANLRAELARAGISARQLAEELGENRGWVHRRIALRNPQSSTIDDLSRIATHLGVPVTRLIEPVTADKTPAAQLSS